MNAWMLALLASSPVLVSKTFTSSQSFTVPAGVTNLVTVSGKGQDGAQAVFAAQTLDLFYCSLIGTVGGEAIGASSAAAFASTQAAKFDGSGVRSVNYTFRSYQINSDNLTIYTDSAISAIVRGTGSMTIGTTSGNLTQSNYGLNFARYTIDVQQSPDTTGLTASGFGQTFPGGVAGPASTSTINNVAVTPLSSYNIAVPSGGSITITYYQ